MAPFNTSLLRSTIRRASRTLAAGSLLFSMAGPATGRAPVSTPDTPWYHRAPLYAAADPPRRAAEFTEQTGTANPFSSSVIPFRSAPAFVDIDGDMDLDLFLGDVCGRVNFFENTGNAVMPAFVERLGGANPLSLVNVGAHSAPALVDIDADGDLDAFVGVGGLSNNLSGQIGFYENTGTANAPAFVARNNAANPFDNVNVGKEAAPAFVDIDGDGDFDAFVGEGGQTDESGQVNFFENTGTANAPSFIQRTGPGNPLAFVDFGPAGEGDSKLSFIDLDDDNDADLIAGDQFGTLHFFENTGTANSPQFIERTGTDNPLDGFDLGGNTSPALVDIDSDSDFDAFVGENNYYLNFFENEEDNPLPVEIASIQATVDGVDVVLGWQTSSETNNLGFEVERSESGSSAWERVGFVEGSGTTFEAQRYEHRLADHPAGQFAFRLRQLDADGTSTYSQTVEVSVELASLFKLDAAYPNPFNPMTTFRLTIQQTQDVTVSVFDASGRRVTVLHDGPLEANQSHAFVVDGSDLASGIYTYVVVGERFRTSRQVTLVK